MEDFLRNNYQEMTNQQLADALQLKLTVTRNKLAELGLKRIEMEYWTPEQEKYLKENFRTMGDVAIAKHFEKTWPKNKKWRKHHIRKKRVYLGLHRSDDDVEAIWERHLAEGEVTQGLELGRGENAASIRLTDNHVAACLSRGKPELKAELQKYPELLEVARQSMLLKREIKNQRNQS